ncbi:hypothetical protein ACFE04_010980 [Oxalis oulophora]
MPNFSSVQSLDAVDFYTTVNNHDYVVVLFYNPGSESFYQYAHQFENVARTLRGDQCPIVLAEFDDHVQVLASMKDSDLVIGKVNMNKPVNSWLATHLKIYGTFTIKIFRDKGNEVHEYKGPFNYEATVEALKRLCRPFPVQINSDIDAASLIGDGNKIVIVGVFPEFCGQEYDMFIKAAGEVKWDYDVGITLDATLLPHGDPSISGPVIWLFKPFDELSVHTKIYSVAALVKFVKFNSTPYVTFHGKSQPQFVEKFFKWNRKNDKVMLFIHPGEKGADILQTKYCAIAHNYKKNDMDFMLGDFMNSQKPFRYFRVGVSDDPYIVIRNSRAEIFVKKMLTPQYDIEAWIQDYKAGKVTTFRKSEPVPQDDNELVKVVVAKNFYADIMQFEKNGVYEVYRTRDENYEKLAPVLDAVAAHFKNDALVIIAKLDETANDIRSEVHFDIKTIQNPMLYLITPAFSIVTYDEVTYDDDDYDAFSKEKIIEFIDEYRSDFKKLNS